MLSFPGWNARKAGWQIGVDETSSHKRRECVTLEVDLKEPQVSYVADARNKASLDPFS